MGYLATTLKIGACLVISVVIIKLASDRQEVLKLLRHQEEPCIDCPDVLVGPAPRMDWPAWLPFAKKMAEEIRLADESEGFDVLFYGDSITEQWRGSGVGSVYPSLQETHRIFLERFNQNYTSHVLAIAGDQTGHLWWRVLNGQTPKKRQPKAIVMLIGTNDLTADDCTQEELASVLAAKSVISRLQQIVLHLRRELPSTEVVLLGLLPRDAHVLSGPPLYEWPNRMTSALDLANLELKGMAEADERVHFLDCGGPYIKAGGGLESRLLPDALHPNPEGMDHLGACIQPLLDELVLVGSGVEISHGEVPQISGD